MNRDEATRLVLACKVLSDRIMKDGFDIELIEQDRVALAGFSRLLSNGAHKDTHIYKVADLNNIDILALGYMREQQLWQQHYNSPYHEIK